MNAVNDSSIIETILDEERVFEGHLVKVGKMNVTLPNGEKAIREVVRHVGASAIVPLDTDGQVTLVRQFRAAVNRVVLEIPAGKLDSKAEDRLLAARRELREETGLEADTWTHLSDIITTPGFTDELISLYLAEDLRQGEAQPDDDEFLNLVKMPLSQAVTMCQTGQIDDAKSICALLLAQKALDGRK
ncbi:MAG: NUDIX hydrolase [Clostridia bacterium]|nr:NUDIX hydrolase [Clostridia bacterium]